MMVTIKDLFTVEEIIKYQLNNLETGIVAIEDLKNKSLNMNMFKTNKMYRLVLSAYIKYLDLKFLHSRMEELIGKNLLKNIENKNIISLFKLFENVGLYKQDIKLVENSLVKMEDISYNLYEGINEDYNIRFKFEKSLFTIDEILFKNENLKLNRKTYENEIEIKFKLKIAKENKVNFIDKILIKTSIGNFEFDIKCTCNASRVVQESDNWIYDFIDNNVGKETFEKRFDVDLLKSLERLEDYKNINIFELATKMSYDYGFNKMEMFEIIKNNKVFIQSDFITSISENNGFEKFKKDFNAKFKSVFATQKSKGISGLNKFLLEGIENKTFHQWSARRIDDRYKEFRLKLISFINNDKSIYVNSISKSKFRLGDKFSESGNFKMKDILTANPYFYLNNIKVPKEFYFYLLENITIFDDLEIKNFIYSKVSDILINDIAFSIKKEKIKYYASIIFKANTQEYNFITQKVNDLSSVNYANKDELVILENEFMDNSFIIELCDSIEVSSYVLLPNGKNKLISMSGSNYYSIENTNNYNMSKLKDIISYSDLSKSNQGIRIYKFNVFYSYFNKKKKIDDYFKDLVIKNNSDFKIIYKEIKDLEINRSGVEIFKENINSKEFLKNFIKECDSEEVLFEILNEIEYDNLSIDIRVCFLTRFYELNTTNLRITELCERMINDKPFIIKKIKDLLDRQYAQGLFTRISKDVINLLKYSDNTGLEKYILKLKIKEKDFDKEFVRIANSLYEKDKNDFDLQESIYIFALNSDVRGLEDVIFEINKEYKDVILLNYNLIINKGTRKSISDSIDKKCLESLFAFYLGKEKLLKIEKDIINELIIKLDYLGNESKVINLLEIIYNDSDLISYIWKRKEQSDKIKKYFINSSKLKIIYLRSIIEYFKKNEIKNIKALEECIDQTEIDLFENEIRNGIGLAKEQVMDIIICLLKVYSIKKEEKGINRVLDLLKMKKDFTYQDIIKIAHDIVCLNVNLAVVIMFEIIIAKVNDEKIDNKQVELFKNLSFLKALESIIEQVIKSNDKEKFIDVFRFCTIIEIKDESFIKQLFINLNELKFVDNITYNYIINKNLEKLSDENQKEIINLFACREDFESAFLYKYKDIIEIDIEDKLLDSYMRAELEFIDLKEEAMKKYFNDNSKFLLLINRKGLNDNIKNMMIEKAELEFEDNIYYVEKIINSIHEFEDDRFEKIKISINNYFDNLYLKKMFFGNYKLKNHIEDELICELELENIFNFKLKQAYYFKENYLKKKVLAYLNEANIDIENITDELQSFELKANCVEIKNIEFNDFLVKIIRFFKFLLELEKYNIFTKGDWNLIFINNVIFVENLRCFIYNDKDKYNKLKKRINTFVDNVELDELDKKAFFESFKKSNNLEDLLENLEELKARNSIDFDNLSLKKKISEFKNLSNENKKSVLEEIILNDSSLNTSRILILDNIELVKKDSYSLRYIMKMFIDAPSLKKMDATKIYDVVNKEYDKKSLMKIDENLKKDFESLIKKRMGLGEKENRKKVKEFKQHIDSDAIVLKN